jgi:hypothetical protein
MGFLTGRLPGASLRWRRVRGLWVLIDREAAWCLGRPVRELNRFVRRHPAWFPDDFSFVLAPEEWQRKWPRFEGGRRELRRPRVYSTAGMLQAGLRIGAADPVELIRWWAKLLPPFHHPPPMEVLRWTPPLPR